EYTRPWNTSDFDGSSAPSSLDGVRVLVNGLESYVSYIGYNQVNAQVGDDPSEGPVNVQVITPVGASNEVTITKTGVTPALQSDSRFKAGETNYVVAFTTDFATFIGPPGLTPGASFRPAQPGETIIVFAVGCGPSFPATPAGQIPTASPRLALPYEFRFGDTVAEAQGVLVSPFIGLYQFAVTVPALSGDVAFELTVDGEPTGQGLFTSVSP
ncbi:MAG: hypothetical protein GY953_58875, partial [bacterium]|nr:hypothetical protein [bacterium]